MTFIEKKSKETEIPDIKETERENYQDETECKLVQFGERQYTTDELTKLFNYYENKENNFQYFIPSLQSIYDPTHGLENEEDTHLVAFDDRDDFAIPNFAYHKHCDLLLHYKDWTYKDGKTYVLPLNIGTKKLNYHNMNNNEAYVQSNQNNGSHWIDIVFIPRVKTTEKQQDEIYVLDSIKDRSSSKNIVELINLLKERVFPEARVIYCNTKQQLDDQGNVRDSYSCGRWVVYNSIMLARTGNLEYLQYNKPLSEIEEIFDNILNGVETSLDIGDHNISYSQLDDDIELEEHLIYTEDSSTSYSQSDDDVEPEKHPIYIEEDKLDDIQNNIEIEQESSNQKKSALIFSTSLANENNIKSQKISILQILGISLLVSTFIAGLALVKSSAAYSFVKDIFVIAIGSDRLFKSFLITGAIASSITGIGFIAVREGHNKAIETDKINTQSQSIESGF